MEIKKNIPFEVKINFEADSKPEIRSACFCWGGDGPYCCKVTDMSYGAPGTIKVRLILTKLGSYALESTPLPSSILSPADLQMFDGRVQDFTYEFVGEQKLLGAADNEIDLKRLSQWKGPGMPWPTENWEIKDVYVIDIPYV